MFEAAAAIEFPFVEKLPKREKSRIQKAWDLVSALNKAQQEKGNLIPYGLAAKVLGVSATRITELRRLGTLDSVEIDGHVFVSEHSLIAFAKSERKAGRPPKLPQSAGEMWKRSREFSQGK